MVETAVEDGDSGASAAFADSVFLDREEFGDISLTVNEHVALGKRVTVVISFEPQERCRSGYLATAKYAADTVIGTDTIPRLWHEKASTYPFRVYRYTY
jgi:hypothetical protein